MRERINAIEYFSNLDASIRWLPRAVLQLLHFQLNPPFAAYNYDLRSRFSNRSFAFSAITRNL
jgi:hypothetical protein